MNELPEYSHPTDKIHNAVNHLSLLLEESGIRYRFIEAGERFSTFMVHEEDYEAYRKAITDVNSYFYPYGQHYGYKFLY